MTSHLWDQLKTVLKERIGEHRFSVWIMQLTPQFDMTGNLTLSCPNPFFLRQMQQQFGELIESEYQQIAATPCKVSFSVAAPKDPASPDEGRNKVGAPIQMAIPELMVRSHSGRFLRKDFTFDQFVVGGNNDFAYSASLSLATRKRQGQSALFLISKTGMGKSHLSQAVGHHILKETPAERVYYVTAEDFSFEMVHAMRSDAMELFKRKYRNSCDVLLLEDVHHLSGKIRTQEELAVTLDILMEANKKIIFSSCYLPAEIPKMDEKLRSRLSSGVITGIEPPNFKTRVRILKRKSVLNGHHIPEEVVQYLASTLTDDIRQLESGLIGVAAKSSLLGAPITMELAESVVNTISRRDKVITMEAIKKLICKEYGVLAKDLVSSSRQKSIVQPRQMAMYLCRKYTDSPLQAIGKSFNRYHATALHAINSIESSIKKETSIRRQVQLLCEKIESGDF